MKLFYANRLSTVLSLTLFLLGFTQTTQAQYIYELYTQGGLATTSLYTYDYVVLAGFPANTSLSSYSVQFRNGSGATTTWTTVALTGSSDAYGIYRLQANAGPNATANLPFTPQQTIAVSIFHAGLASGGGPAMLLVNSTTALPAGCPSSGFVDKLGYIGTAVPAQASVCPEGTSAPVLLVDGTEIYRRKTLNGAFVDANNNASDFDIVANAHKTAPTITTAAASSIAPTSATLGGDITGGDGANFQRGIVYGTSPNPTTSNTKVPISSGTGTFSQNITGLTTGVTYYVRSYMINALGVSYGNEISFVPASACTAPSITTAASSNSPICSGTALNLSVTAAGTAPLNYSWTGTGSFTNGTTSSPSVTGAATGNYTVTAYNACGSVQSTATVTVNASPMPTITGLNAQYCKTSGIINLAGNPSGGSFMVNGSAASSFDTDLLTTGATNTVNYSYTDGNGCSGTAPQATFQVLAIPPAVTLTANAVSPQCLNSTVTITAPAADKYAWYKNGAFLQWANSPNNTLAVTASSTTDTYNVYTYNAATNFCPSALSNTISVVGTFPVATITPSFAPPYCLNKVPVLSGVPPTGFGYTYSWTCPTCSTTTNSPTLTPTAQNGDYSVTVTDANGCSKTSNVLNVVLNAVPSVNAGADFSTCISFPVALGNTNTTTGYTYQWTPSTNLSSAIVGKPNVTPTSTTPITYTLRVTRTSTGCYAEDDVVVIGITQPDATTLSTSSTAAVCQPASITLTPGVVNNVFWYKNGAIMNLTPSAGAKTFFSSALNGDIYTVRNFDGTCKSNESTPITLTIKAAPAPTLTSTPAIIPVSGSFVASICNQQTTGTAALVANIPSGAPAVTSYNWQQNIGGTNINLSPAVSTSNYTASVAASPAAQNNKSFRVQATYANGCSNSSINVFVRLQPVGCTARMNGEVEENLAESFTVYPNPTENSLNISLANFATENGNLILYNTLGQVILSESISLSEGKAEQSWDLTSLSPGIYNLVFQTEKGQSVQKIVKE